MTQKCEKCGKRLSKVDAEKNKGAEKVLCSGCAKKE